ncbi:MAG: TetR/AcrR family transcriptional regulator [Myxococcales bacterium]|nr:TetR/AcrR family transcriptional regulator [Myxococcales bacterium]
MSSARAKREVTSPKGMALKRPGPPGGVRDTNRLKKSQAIRDAALLLFLERGIEGVSVDDIMKAAKMAKGSFYRYFADQTALVDDLMSETKRVMVDALEATSSDLETAATRDTQVRAYKRIGEVLATLLLEHPGEVRLYLQESRAPAVGARKPIIDLAALVTRYALEMTTKAQQHRILKPIPVSVSALSVVGATERLLLAVLQGEDIGDVLEVPAALTTLILDGLKA